ncbi:twinfilin-1-like [Saccoglossus kowalevskii]|uniref:Twinfilin-1-like n=1 Tax=Saccoglossus kowalevskii TaxID=10224 RepID=A0ABM0GW12_SACKO|nr:PREDICTED: twinfilin-1-like [Saccoglossus kowalevskii]
MSHQTGITTSPDLQKFFAKVKDGSQRVIKVVIENEQLVLSSKAKSSGSWEKDYDNAILPLLKSKQACYIFYRLDTTNASGYEWIFILYVPDDAPVREKMLYSSTKATLKLQFGGAHIKEDIFGTSPDDVSFKGYSEHKESQKAPPPLTFAEEELKLIKANEVDADISVDSRHQTMRGVAFPFSDGALESLQEFRGGRINYLQLSIHMQQECIQLELGKTINITDLPQLTPSTNARYHVLLFKHTHEGDYMESVVFIYTMPGYSCPIKERMLYSSCKSSVAEVIEQRLGTEIVKKIEVDDPNDLTEEFIYEEVHPKKTIVKPKFAKPKGPGGRGPRRMAKGK